MSGGVLPPKEAAVQALLDVARTNARTEGLLADMLGELKAIRIALEAKAEDYDDVEPEHQAAPSPAPSSPAAPASPLSGMNLGGFEGLINAELAKRGIDTSKPGFDPMSALTTLLASQQPTPPKQS